MYKTDELQRRQMMPDDRQPEHPVVPHAQLGQDQIDLIKRTICKGASNDQLALFVQQCNRTGLDPFNRQIYSMERRAKNRDTGQWETARQIQISIDGLRLISERTGKYAGQLGPLWCGTDGEWKDVWLSDDPPAAAKVGILRVDFHEPIWGVALYREYVQTSGPSNEPNAMWKKMPANQLAKCAESLAHRKAFPQELSGLYTTEEMGRADNIVNGETVNGKQAISNGPPEIPDRPWQPTKLRELIAYQVGKSAASHEPCSRSDEQGGLLAGKLREVWAGDDDAEPHAHDVLNFLVGDPSTKQLSKAEAITLLNWLVGPKDETGDCPLKPMAVQEANLVLRLVQTEAGQIDMFGDGERADAPTDPEEKEQGK